MAKEVKLPTGNEKLDTFMMQVVWKRDPDVRLYEKQSSALMWTLYVAGFMWIWNKWFFSRFHTTIGKRVYIKKDSIAAEDWAGIYRVLRHEYIHILQRRRYWLLYDVAYLFPQVLAVLAIPSFLSIWFGLQWLWSLGFLAFLAPIPAYWRMRFEIEGYTQTLLVEYEMRGQISEGLIRRVAEKFTGSTYYFMWPFNRDVRARLGDIVDKIYTGKINTPHLHYSH